ncbi:peptidoglycan-binding domain-containing protein [Actinomadura citrea]|uniref:Peptidoglycan hydrolase-like protein with peptidoglycan-binding domain n=1 Tax=Actinomadura citrea TaxID=46158 RepID=A0A7Y9KBV8_9ACTN|nr:peptidoglycan-binding domain-containing protein [Actinomadura citrea]NYE11770.1 peptidoglycan hydrolase-like protein with peptidoglycan-binding domain [Actinomadura citrea]GGT91490.1 peptidoglycan-binding protein [Actinomadura citrea]
MEETIAERAPAEREGRRARRGRPRLRIALAVAAVVAAGGAATVAVLAAGGDRGGGRAAALPPGTAKVARETLSDTQTEDGRLGYGPTLNATSQARGTITWLPESGDEVTRGRRLYELDGDPVVLMYGSKPSYRPLRIGTEGSDVKRFEQNLSALGYDGFTVDDEYTSGTAEAVREWQDDIGAPQTGTVDVGRVAYAGGPVRIETVTANPGEPAAPGKKILGYTGTTQAVTVELDTADQRLAKKGARVEVTLPEGRPVTAEIDEVTTVIEPGEQGEDPATKVEVTIWLDSAAARKAAARYALASADVRFTAGRRENVLTVPVSALVALREGGFGVEVVKGGASSYVPVETGLFADGKVEVSGPGIAEGALVGVPK